MLLQMLLDEAGTFEHLKAGPTDLAWICDPPCPVRDDVSSPKQLAGRQGTTDRASLQEQLVILSTAPDVAPSVSRVNCPELGRMDSPLHLRSASAPLTTPSQPS